MVIYVNLNISRISHIIVTERFNPILIKIYLQRSTKYIILGKSSRRGRVKSFTGDSTRPPYISGRN